MHHLDLGLFHYHIDYTIKLIKMQNESSLIDEIDRRIAVIPRYPGLKIFSGGLQTIFRFTASKYCDLMKVMVFVIDNLYDENTKNIEGFIKNKDLTELYKS